MTMLDFSPYSTVPQFPSIGLGAPGLPTNPAVIGQIMGANVPGGVGGYPSLGRQPLALGPGPSTGSLLPATIPMGNIVDDIAPNATGAGTGYGRIGGAAASAARSRATPIVEQVVPQATGRLSKFYQPGQGLTRLGRGTVAGVAPLAANALLSPLLQPYKDEGGAGGMIAGGIGGGLSASAIGAPLLMSGNPFAMAGGAAIIGGGALLGALGGGKGKEDPKEQVGGVIDSLVGAQIFTVKETQSLKGLANVLLEAGTPPEDILNQLILPKIQEKEQADLQAQQQAMYVQQLKDYFTQQQQAIGVSSAFGSLLGTQVTDQMRADADNRDQLMGQLIGDAEGAKFTDAYKNTLLHSQNMVSDALRAQASGFQQQLALAPYLAMQQEQANIYQQIMQQQGLALQPAYMQTGGVNPAVVAQQQALAAQQQAQQAGAATDPNTAAILAQLGVSG